MVLALPVVATLLSFYYNASAFWSVLLFFGLLAVYLALRSPQHVGKALLFSLVTAVPAIVMIDYIAHLNGQWLIPNSILPYRFLHYVTLEVVVWAVLNFFTVTMFYKHFFDKRRNGFYWYPRQRHILIFGVGLVLFFFTTLFADPHALHLPYFYLLFGIGTILLPIAFEFVGHRKLIPKFIFTGTYFFYLSFLYEVTALKLHWWSFPSPQFIGYVSVLNVSFPLEEFIFWLMLLSMAILVFFVKFENSES